MKEEHSKGQQHIVRSGSQPKPITGKAGHGARSRVCDSADQAKARTAVCSARILEQTDGNCQEAYQVAARSVETSDEVLMVQGNADTDEEPLQSRSEFQSSHEAVEAVSKSSPTEALNAALKTCRKSLKGNALEASSRSDEDVLICGRKSSMRRDSYKDTCRRPPALESPLAMTSELSKFSTLSSLSTVTPLASCTTLTQSALRKSQALLRQLAELDLSNFPDGKSDGDSDGNSDDEQDEPEKENQDQEDPELAEDGLSSHALLNYLGLDAVIEGSRSRSPSQVSSRTLFASQEHRCSPNSVMVPVSFLNMVSEMWQEVKIMQQTGHDTPEHTGVLPNRRRCSDASTASFLSSLNSTTLPSRMSPVISDGASTPRIASSSLASTSVSPEPAAFDFRPVASDSSVAMAKMTDDLRVALRKALDPNRSGAQAVDKDGSFDSFEKLQETLAVADTQGAAVVRLSSNDRAFLRELLSVLREEDEGAVGACSAEEETAEFPHIEISSPSMNVPHEIVTPSTPPSRRLSMAAPQYSSMSATLPATSRWISAPLASVVRMASRASPPPPLSPRGVTLQPVPPRGPACVALRSPRQSLSKVMSLPQQHFPSIAEMAYSAPQFATLRPAPMTEMPIITAGSPGSAASIRGRSPDPAPIMHSGSPAVQMVRAGSPHMPMVRGGSPRIAPVVRGRSPSQLLRVTQSITTVTTTTKTFSHFISQC